MTYIDVAIPAFFSVMMLLWPQAVFYGSRVTPDEKKIRLIRRCGMVLLVVALLYLGIVFIERG